MKVIKKCPKCKISEISEQEEVIICAACETVMTVDGVEDKTNYALKEDKSHGRFPEESWK